MSDYILEIVSNLGVAAFMGYLMYRVAIYRIQSVACPLKVEP